MWTKARIRPYLEESKVPEDLQVVFVHAEGVDIALDGLQVVSIRPVQKPAGEREVRDQCLPTGVAPARVQV